jgi:hypothetical protein
MRGNIDPWTHSSTSENLHLFVHSRHKAAGENISKFTVRCGDPPVIPANSKIFITVTDASIPNVATNLKEGEDYVIIYLEHTSPKYMRIDFTTDFYTVDGLLNWYNECVSKSYSYGNNGSSYAKIYDTLEKAVEGLYAATSISQQEMDNFKLLVMEKLNDILYIRPSLNFTGTPAIGVWYYFSNEKTASRFGYFESNPMMNPKKFENPFSSSVNPADPTTSNHYYYKRFSFDEPPVLISHNSVQIRANLSFANSYETYDSNDYHVNTVKSNILASFPVTGGYGDLLAYEDRMTALEVSGKTMLDVIELELTDEDGELLNLKAEWSCCLTISFRPSTNGVI